MGAVTLMTGAFPKDGCLIAVGVMKWSIYRQRDRYIDYCAEVYSSEKYFDRYKGPHWSLLLLLLFIENSIVKPDSLSGPQTGSYFGSELCSLDVNQDGVTDYLLVGAPLYHIHGEEGRVYVYRLKKEVKMLASAALAWWGLFQQLLEILPLPYVSGDK